MDERAYPLGGARGLGWVPGAISSWPHAPLTDSWRPRRRSTSVETRARVSFEATWGEVCPAPCRFGARLGRAKLAYTTRRVRFDEISSVVADATRPSRGDLVLARVQRLGHHKKLEAFLAAPLVVMRGCLDRERDQHPRTTRRAEAQGRDRFERAAAMVRAGIEADPRCRWRLSDVPGAGHDERQMAPAAQDLLASPRASA